MNLDSAVSVVTRLRAGRPRDEFG